jgi:hypothetical protein
MAVLLVGIFVAFVAFSYQWPMVGDAQVFLYDNFMMQHGFAPYRDIPDINMPGAHVVENWQLLLFGGSDLGLRVYDFTLLGLLTLAMIVVARPYDWLAGLFAGILFLLQHAALGGPWNAGERDEIIAVLIIVGYAFLFEGVRRSKPLLLLGFGFALGIANTLKPTVAPLGLALLVVAVVAVRKKGLPYRAYIAWPLIGAAVAGAIAVSFLLQHHVLSAYIYCVRTYIPLYAGMDRLPLHLLVRRVLPFVAWMLLPFAVTVSLTTSGWRNWETVAVLVGAVFGAVSYFAQGKGLGHHTYPLVACLLLWICIELMSAERSQKRTRWVSVAGVMVGLFVAIPIYCYRVAHTIPRNGFIVSLESDLNQMGGSQLTGRIQCLDVVYGCYVALYHMQLVQSTPYVGDILFFAPQKSPAIDHLREMAWRAITGNPPAVIVVSNEWFGRTNTFDKIKNWPRFAAYLSESYRLAVERNFTGGASTGYQIFVRKSCVN